MDVAVWMAAHCVLWVVGLLPETPCLCFLLLVLYKREQACAVRVCPLALSLGFPPSFAVSMFTAFVAFVIRCRGYRALASVTVDYWLSP